MIGGSKLVSSRHWSLKEKAQHLRAKGLSYKEILRQVPVAKSSISLWCRDVPLTTAQRKRLWEKRDHSLKGIKAIQQMFWRRRCEAFARGVAQCPKLDRTARFIAGLMLYYGEGDKARGSAAIANSDPRIIRYTVSWLQEFFGVRPTEISIHLHLHSGQDEEKMKRYWSRLTGVPLKNFQKSFVKPEGSGYRKNVLHYGTIRLTVRRAGSTYLLFQILGGISQFLKQAIGDPIEPTEWMQKLPYA